MDARVKPAHDAECIDVADNDSRILKQRANERAGAAPGPVVSKCLFRGQEPARAFSMKSVRNAFFQSGIAETFFSWISASVCLVR